MNLKYYLLSLCLISSIKSATQENENEESNHDVFVATKYWQVVKKGQPIPKGLHVRINFETGVTEAKLYDEPEYKNTAGVVAVIPIDAEDSNEKSAGTGNGNSAGISNEESAGNSKYLSPEQIANALKNIKNDESTKHVKKDKYRTYTEIKEELGEANMFPKTDAEVMRKLLNEYIEILPKKDNQGVILIIVQDLEYLAHQYDNAIEFISLNGFRELIYKNLNISNAEIKKTTLVLLGSLAQNNPKVQIHALETGCVNVLLRLLAIETDNEVNIKVIHALGSILRRFPLAQQKFIDNGGLSILLKLYDSENMKLCLKITILLNDLIFEHDMLEVVQEDPQTTYYKDKIAQYENIGIKKKLLQMDYCEYIHSLFIRTIVVDTQDYESMETCLIAMTTVADQCKCQYSSKMLKNILKDSEKIRDNELKLLITNILKTMENCKKDEL